MREHKDRFKCNKDLLSTQQHQYKSKDSGKKKMSLKKKIFQPKILYCDKIFKATNSPTSYAHPSEYDIVILPFNR